MNYQRELLILVGVLAVIGGAFAYGYHKGSLALASKYEVKRIELQEEILDLNESLTLKNADILKLAKEKQELIDELEEQALQAPGSSNPGVATTGGLQRLERRWGKGTTSP